MGVRRLLLLLLLLLGLAVRLPWSSESAPVGCPPLRSVCAYVEVVNRACLILIGGHRGRACLSWQGALPASVVPSFAPIAKNIDKAASETRRS